jgi:single-strand DNA-binding protein
MSVVNNCTFIGRLTKDGEFIQNQKITVYKNTIAVSEKFGDKERTLFLDFQVFGKYAELFNKYTFKGQKIALNGSLIQDSWVDNNGNKKTKIKLNVESGNFLEFKENDSPAKSSVHKQQTNNTQQSNTNNNSNQQKDITQIDDSEIPF